MRAKPGDRVSAGTPILDLFYRDPARLGPAAMLARAAIGLSDDPAPAGPLIVGEVR